MWKRDEAVKPTAPASPGPAPARTGNRAACLRRRRRDRRAASDPQRGQEKTAVNIGKSVVIKGELNGSEDLTIEGQVEGKIELRQNVLTIGPNGKIKAQVFAKSVIILGEVTGNVTASEKVDIRDNGSVDGDIAAPRVAIAEGAHFRGSIDMQRAGAQAGRAAPQGRRRSRDASSRRHRRRPAPAGRSGYRRRRPVSTQLGRPRSGQHSPVPGLGRTLDPDHHPCCPIFSAGAGSAPTQPDAGRRRARARGAEPVVAVQGAAEDSSPRCRSRRTCRCSSTSARSSAPTSSSSASSSAASCSSRISSPSIDRHARAGTLDELPEALDDALHAMPTPASTACCAGTSSTSSKRRGPGAGARRSSAMLRPGGAVMGFFSPTAVERAAVHEVRNRRRQRRCGTAITPATGGAEARARRTATSSRCSTG